MKELLLSLVFIVVTGALKAQSPVATPVAPQSKIKTQAPVVTQTYYCCRFCDYTAITERSCPIHQVSLIKVGNWYCPRNGKSFEKAGICPEDQSKLVRMDMKFQKVTPKPADLKRAEPVKK